MKDDGIVIRQATEADVRHFANGGPLPTVRALVGEKDGELLAIGGYRYVNFGRLMRQVLFFDIKPEGRKYKRAMLRGIKLLLDMRRGPVVAICNGDEPGAPALMKRMGMEPIGRAERGVVYQCG